MSGKSYGIILATIVAAFIIGRYSAPEKIKIETKTITVQSEKSSTDDSKEQEKIITNIKRKDGTEVTRTRFINKSEQVNQVSSETKQITSEKKEITSRRGVIISFLAGAPLTLSTSPRFVGGASFVAPLFGPIFIGGTAIVTPEVYGLMSLGLEF